MIYLTTTGFIVFDFMTGIVNGFKNKEFNSSIMREGLFHKFGSLICICLGIAVDFAQRYVDIGTTIPVSKAICTYIILMEISSIIENIGNINPALVPNKIKKMFIKLQDENEDK